MIPAFIALGVIAIFVYATKPSPEHFYMCEKVGEYTEYQRRRVKDYIGKEITFSCNIREVYSDCDIRCRDYIDSNRAILYSFEHTADEICKLNKKTNLIVRGEVTKITNYYGEDCRIDIGPNVIMKIDKRIFGMVSEFTENKR